MLLFICHRHTHSFSVSLCLPCSLFALLSKKHNKVLEQATQSLRGRQGESAALPDYVSKTYKHKHTQSVPVCTKFNHICQIMSVLGLWIVSRCGHPWQFSWVDRFAFKAAYLHLLVLKNISWFLFYFFQVNDKWVFPKDISYLFFKRNSENRQSPVAREPCVVLNWLVRGCWWKLLSETGCKELYSAAAVLCKEHVNVSVNAWQLLAKW